MYPYKYPVTVGVEENVKALPRIDELMMGTNNLQEMRRDSIASLTGTPRNNFSMIQRQFPNNMGIGTNLIENPS